MLNSLGLWFLVALMSAAIVSQSKLRRWYYQKQQSSSAGMSNVKYLLSRSSPPTKDAQESLVVSPSSIGSTSLESKSKNKLEGTESTRAAVEAIDQPQERSS